MQNTKKVQTHLKEIKKYLPENFIPACALVLGTGLGELAEAVEEKVSIPYEKLQDFPKSTVDSHKGQFIAGYFNKIPLIIQQGRCHLYEGRNAEECVRGIRVMSLMGAKKLILTNAAGSINPLFSTGSLMAIADHINMTAHSPLRGSNDEKLGPRFPDQSRIYSKRLLEILHKKALELGITLQTGVYLGIMGPQLESPAETRFFRTIGADAVGMSTVLEAMAANHMGMEIAALSCLSNQNLPDCMAKSTLEEIIENSAKPRKNLSRLLKAALPDLVSSNCQAQTAKPELPSS